MQLIMTNPNDNFDGFSIRELMPRNFTKILREKTGRAAPYITLVVNKERSSSPIWEAVLKLAEENKPKIIAEKHRLDSLKSKPAA